MKRIAIFLSAIFICVSGVLTMADDAALVARDNSPIARVESSRAADELMQSGAMPAVAVSRRQIWMEVTAYCACEKCCGPHASGITASGLPVSYNLGRFAAADSAVLPLGSSICVPGYHQGQPIPVIDRGGAIKGTKLDVFFPTHERALQWGRRWLLVTIETPDAPA